MRDIVTCTFPEENSKHYNRGGSGSSETELTDKENNSLWCDCDISAFKHFGTISK